MAREGTRSATGSYISFSQVFIAISAIARVVTRSYAETRYRQTPTEGRPSGYRDYYYHQEASTCQHGCEARPKEGDCHQGQQAGWCDQEEGSGQEDFSQR